MARKPAAAESAPASDPTPITRIPLANTQGHGVTLALTGIDPQPEICNVCASKVRGIGDHHIVFRSRGGTEGPTLPVCLTCHDMIHKGEWKLTTQEEGEARGLYIHDAEGKIIWRLLAWPFDNTGAGDLVNLLARVAEVQQMMPDLAPALLPYQAVEVFAALRAVSSGSWKATARLIAEMHRYRMPGRSAPEKIEALQGLFALRQAQIYNYLQIVDAFQDTDVLETTELPMEMLVEAAGSNDPPAWAKLAQERRVTHPQFGRGDLHKEIQTQKAAAVGNPPPATGGKPVWAKCPNCGEPGWMERLPVGSDGQPVQLEDYQDD